jgi:hypothetical protein
MKKMSDQFLRGANWAFGYTANQSTTRSLPSVESLSRLENHYKSALIDRAVSPKGFHQVLCFWPRPISWSISSQL